MGVGHTLWQNHGLIRQGENTTESQEYVKGNIIIVHYGV